MMCFLQHLTPVNSHKLGGMRGCIWVRGSERVPDHHVFAGLDAYFI